MISRHSFFVIFLVVLVVCFGENHLLFSSGPNYSQYIFKTWTTRDGLPQNAVSRMVRSPKGYLWVKTAGGTVRFDGMEFLPLEPDKKNTARLATSTLIPGNPRLGEIKEYFRNREFFNGTITTFFEDSDGITWLGSASRGLGCLYPSPFRFYGREHGLSHQYVTSVYRDTEGNVCVSTLDGGLHRFSTDTGTFTHFGQSQGLDMSLVILAGDGNGGSYRFWDNIFQPVRLETVPLTGPIGAILEDDRKNTWISTANGLHCVKAGDLLYFGAGLLRSTVFTSGSQPTGLKTPDGRLWFATPEGVTVVPASGPWGGTFHKRQPVYIEAIVVDGETMEGADSLHLPSGTVEIVIPFSAPNFKAPESLVFKCRLQKNSYDILGNLWPDGEEETVTRVRYVTYKNLPAGRYSVSIIARNMAGNWNEDNETIPSVEFYINRPFTETIWFFLVLIVTGLLAAVLLLRLSRKKTKSEPQELIASHEDKYKTFKLTNKESKAYLKMLVEFMEQEKPYLDTRCSLVGLAQELETSKEVLSQVVNRELHLNFNAFVNNYRVEEAKRKLRDPKENQYVILKIAHDVGFNSKSSFNAVFKKMTGLSPSQYRERHQKVEK